MKEAKRLDRVSAEIQVGGDLSSGAVDALCQAITAQGVSWAHGDALFAPESAADLLEVVDEAGHLHLYCDAAAYGMFSELEEHLTALGLPFDRKSDAGAGFDAELEAFRPGNETQQLLLDGDGKPVVSLKDVLAAIDLIEAGQGPEAASLLVRKSGRDLAPLPPLRIVTAEAACSPAP
jgi:hypothetical protein